MLVLSTMDGAGAHRLAAAHVVAVGQLQPQPLDGHGALHVGLLVDGELDLLSLAATSTGPTPAAESRSRPCTSPPSR